MPFEQNVKAYLRRGTARESLLLYKEAALGNYLNFFFDPLIFALHTTEFLTEDLLAILFLKYKS